MFCTSRWKYAGVPGSGPAATALAAPTSVIDASATTARVQRTPPRRVDGPTPRRGMQHTTVVMQTLGDGDDLQELGHEIDQLLVAQRGRPDRIGPRRGVAEG